MPHVFLNGAFGDADAQLESFATDPFRSPEPILRRHFLDQGHGFCGYLWFGRCCSGLVLPEQARIPADATAGASLVGHVMCACLHARDARARRTRIRRSDFAHVGRLTCRRRMRSCCRRRAFSATSSDCCWQGQPPYPTEEREWNVWSSRRSGGGATENTGVSSA